MGHQTHGGTMYGPGYHDRLLTPEDLRNASLPRRGLLRRWYAAKDVRQVLAFVAADIETRTKREEELTRIIRQLRQQYESTQHALRDWQTQHAQHVCAAQNPK